MDIATLMTRIKRSAGYRATRYSDLVYQGMQNSLISLRQRFEALRGEVRLKGRFPQLRDYESLAGPHRDQLRPYYETYVSQFSDPGWAISLELSVFLLTLCQLLQPQRLLDVGSGFSSFVFRHYAAHATPQPQVWSVDDSAEWLEKTVSYLKQNGLPADNVCQWQPFVDGGPGKFDLILHDMAFGQRRMEELPSVLDLCKPTGVVVLDDVHIESYHGYAMKILNKRRLIHYSLKSFTVDSFNRYSELVRL
jgi:predicted O-methyltransferase YrrM